MKLPYPPLLDRRETGLFLDIDGTLAEFRRVPDEVGPTPRLTALLHGLNSVLSGRVAVISGRTLSDVDRIAMSTIAAASGVHGLEQRYADGRLEQASPHPGLEPARAAFHAAVAKHPCLLLEDKGLGLVLHYRAAPDLAELAQRTASQVAEETGLTLQRGDMMVEVRTPGRTKGDALRSFMATPPFKGCRPVYVGDDLTDEWAFRAARECDGFGVLVGPERATAATCRLENVEAALAWLESLVDQPAAQTVTG